MLVRQPTPRSLADEWFLSDGPKIQCGPCSLAITFVRPPSSIGHFGSSHFVLKATTAFGVDRQCSVGSRKVFCGSYCFLFAFLSAVPWDARDGVRCRFEVKHLELRDALEIGDASVVAELANSWPRGCENANTVRCRFHGGKFGEVRFLQGTTRREEAQYGLRALRVGEASHPGPPGRHRSNQGVPDDVCSMPCSRTSPEMIQIPGNIWSEMVENINPQSERQTHNCGRIPINCRGEQEEDWAAMATPLFCRRRDGFGWGKKGWCWSHRKAHPRQGTTHFGPSVDGSCKFGGSSKMGVGQFSTTRAQCDSNFQTCVQRSGPSEQI